MLSQYSRTVGDRYQVRMALSQWAVPNAGMITDKEMLDKLLDQYYELHGWDVDTAIPLLSTLEQLGLAEVCGDVALES